MSNRVKLPADSKGVVVRADGRKLVRVFVYLGEANAKELKRHCFEHGEDMSAFIDRTVGQALAKGSAKRKASKTKKREAPATAEAASA